MEAVVSVMRMHGCREGHGLNIGSRIGRINRFEPIEDGSGCSPTRNRICVRGLDYETSRNVTRVMIPTPMRLRTNPSRTILAIWISSVP